MPCPLKEVAVDEKLTLWLNLTIKLVAIMSNTVMELMTKTDRQEVTFHKVSRKLPNLTSILALNGEICITFRNVD